MAKRLKKDPGETPRGFTGASHVEVPAARPAEATAKAPFEGPTTQESAITGVAGAGEAWAPQATVDTVAVPDERDRIAARAYELYLERGGSGGTALDDWLAAEREFSTGDPVKTNDRRSGE